MKKYLSLLAFSLCVALMFSAPPVAVVAQVPTLSLTPSIVPSITPTIDPYLGQCPVWPEGFDFSLLPYDYVSRCSSCIPTDGLTLTPVATSVFPTIEIPTVVLSNDWLTEFPTEVAITSTPTIPAMTSTPTPTATPSGAGVFTFDNAFITHQGSYSGEVSSMTCSSPIGTTDLNYISCEFSASHTDGHSILNSLINFDMAVSNDYFVPDPTYYWKITETSIISGNEQASIVYAFTGTSTEFEGSMASAHMLDQRPFTVQYRNRTLEDGDTFLGALSAHAKIEISTLPIITIIPTPTATPVLGFCSEIPEDLFAYAPIVETNGLINTIAGECFELFDPVGPFDFDEITFGGYVIIPAIHIELSGIRVCPIYVEFNTTRIADITIPDAIFAIGLAWTIFKLIF
jgi:hypothetical protein